MQNVQEVVATLLTSHTSEITTLRSLCASQAEALEKSTRAVEEAAERIGRLEEREREGRRSENAVDALGERVRSLERSSSVPPTPPPVPVTATTDSSLLARVEALEIDRQVDANNLKVMRMVEARLSEWTRPSSPPRSPLPSSSSDMTSDILTLQSDVASLTALLATAASASELERAKEKAEEDLRRAVGDVRAEVDGVAREGRERALAADRSDEFEVGFGGGKENRGGAPAAAASAALRTSILDEIAISRPDRSETERLLMSRLEPVARSLNSLQVEVGEVRRLAASVPAEPTGGVDQAQLSDAVTKAVRTALSNDGDRVTRSHLTAAVDGCRETVGRNLEGAVREARAGLVEAFSGEMASAKEATWDALGSLRGRVDDLERTVEVSSTEVVAVLNRKAYKTDVATALMLKCDSAIVMNTLRGKADTVTMTAALATKAGDVETGERAERTRVAVGEAVREIGEAVREIGSVREEMRGEVERMGERVKRKVDKGEVDDLKMGVVSGAEWRTAVSDVSMNLRREMADKANREETIQLVRREVDGVKETVGAVRVAVDGKSDAATTSQLAADVESLAGKFAEAHSEARWLWRSGKILKGGWIPWEVQVTNAAPGALIWKPGAGDVTCAAPGLYSVKVGVFTLNAACIQICVNGEPVVSLDPNTDPNHDAAPSAPTGAASEHIRRRHRHTAGDVSCAGCDEVMALPANAVLGVRFDSGVRAQGFLSVRKL